MEDKITKAKFNFDKGADISIIDILKTQGFKNFEYRYHDTDGQFISEVSCDRLTEDWIKSIWKNRDMADLPNEVWKDIHGQSDHMVSNMGRIKSKDRWSDFELSNTDKRFVQGIIRKQFIEDMKYKSGNGVLMVNTKGAYAVRSIVGKAFIDKDGHMFKNINGDIYDNRVENLEMVNKRKKKWERKRNQ